MEDKTLNLYTQNDKSDHTQLKNPKRSKIHSEAESDSTDADSLLASGDSVKKPFRVTAWRWVALIFMNLLLIGYFAVFDSPQPLETAIKDTLQVTDQQYSYLYSLLAVPNLVLPLIAGYIVDKIGARRSLFSFGFMVLIGQAILTYGAHELNFNTMIAGRVIYSLGADPLSIGQSVMITKWFKGKELALAFSLGTLMAGGGKAFCSIVTPILYESTGSIAFCFGFGCILCLFSQVCVVIVVMMDKANEEREIAIDPDYAKRAEHTETASLSDVKKFKPIVWLLVFNFGLLDGVVFTLRSFLNDFYQASYGYSNSKAGNYISLHYLVMAFTSPLMGRFLDKFGLRASALFYNSFLGVIAMLFYVFNPSCDQCDTPIIPLILFGICVGIDDVTVFSSLPLVLEEKYLGTGFGFYFVVENIILTALPPMAASIKESYTSQIEGYYWIMVFILGFAILSVVESFALFVVDRRQGRVLEKVAKNEEEKTKETENEFNLNERITNAGSAYEYIEMAY